MLSEIDGYFVNISKNNSLILSLFCRNLYLSFQLRLVVG
jgi:hypothetical protein